jgi:hypothetical protein
MILCKYMAPAEEAAPVVITQFIKQNVPAITACGFGLLTHMNSLFCIGIPG